MRSIRSGVQIPSGPFRMASFILMYVQLIFTKVVILTSLLVIFAIGLYATPDAFADPTPLTNEKETFALTVS